MNYLNAWLEDIVNQFCYILQGNIIVLNELIANM